MFRRADTTNGAISLPFQHIARSPNNYDRVLVIPRFRGHSNRIFAGPALISFLYADQYEEDFYSGVSHRRLFDITLMHNYLQNRYT